MGEYDDLVRALDFGDGVDDREAAAAIRALVRERDYERGRADTAEANARRTQQAMAAQDPTAAFARVSTLEVLLAAEREKVVRIAALMAMSYPDYCPRCEHVRALASPDEAAKEESGADAVSGCSDDRD